MRPPAASKRSSPGINARTKLTIPSLKLTIPSLVRYRKSLFSKVVPGDTTFAKLGGRDGQIMYRPLSFSRFWSGDENNASEGGYHTPFIIGSQIMEACLIRFYWLFDFTAVVFFCSFACHLM